MKPRVQITATRIHVDGISDRDYEDLKPEFSYFLPRSIHSKAYRKGHWDGFVCLLKYRKEREEAVLSTGLYSRLLKNFSRMNRERDGFDYDLIDDRPEYELVEFCTYEDISNHVGKPFHLRYFQEDALDQIMRHRRGLVVAPPRAGKTIVAMELFRRTSLPMLYVVWSLSVAEQAVKNFKDFLPGVKVGRVYDGIVDIEGCHIVVATAQSLAWAFDLNFKKGEKPTKPRGEKKETVLKESQYKKVRNKCYDSRCVVWDEAHHVGIGVARDLSQEFVDAQYVVGLTGTPWREDGADLLLEHVIGPILYHLPYSEAVEAGIILPLDVLILSFRAAEVLQDSYQQVYEDVIVQDQRYHDLVTGVVDHFRNKGRTVAVIVAREQHGKKLTDWKTGISQSVFVYGESTKTERKRAWSLIESRDGTCIVSTLLDEAIDLPSLDVIVVADVRKSGIKAMQRLRSMTAREGKQRATAVFFLPTDVPYLEEHASRAIRFLCSEQPPFRVYERRVYADGTFGERVRRASTARPGRKRNLTILDGATERERATCRESSRRRSEALRARSGEPGAQGSPQSTKRREGPGPESGSVDVDLDRGTQLLPGRSGTNFRSDHQDTRKGETLHLPFD